MILALEFKFLYIHALIGCFVLYLGEPQKKKCRGPTLMNAVYTRNPREKKVIKVNVDLQCVADDDRVIAEFSNFLGTLARQAVPLDYISWHKYPEQQKEELWRYVHVTM